MKISLEWLRDYIDIDCSAEQVAEILSDLGFPCEGIEKVGDDTVIDVEITSNRGDCLGHIGIARELAAGTGKKIRMPVVEPDESEKNTSEFVEVRIDEPDLCGRYTARIIEGVKVAPSPDWLRRRIEAVGMRSVNNVVDATNYAMMETGQPPHAFDYARVSEGKIVVRRAVAGERLISIDGTQCELKPEMLVIADSQRPVAIAGVMGGLDSEVNESTTTILLEDAHFDPVCVRSTSRRLALPSEAAFRFERVVDIEAVDWASKRTAQLIIQAAGGRVAKGVVDVYPGKSVAKKVVMRLSRLNKLLGIDIAAERATEILSALSFEPSVEGDLITCTVPSWRSDVYREVDLIEEVARVHGYNKIPTERKIKIEVVPVDFRQKVAESARTYLNACGYYETINVTFVDNSTAGLFHGDGAEHLAVRDESRKSANLLRRTLIDSLLSVLKTNANAKNLPCRIFEIADTFVPPTDESGKLPVERTKLALVYDGEFRELRGAVEGLIKKMGRDVQVDFEPIDLVWAQSGAQITVNTQTIGTAGIISDVLRQEFDFKDITPCAAEIDFDQLLSMVKNETRIKAIPRFPAIQRDLSLIVDEQIPWANIIKAIKGPAPQELEDVKFVGIYRGKSIAQGKKSVTLSLRFRDEDGTLTHEKVDCFEADIVRGLTESTGAELRTA